MVPLEATGERGARWPRSAVVLLFAALLALSQSALAVDVVQPSVPRGPVNAGPAASLRAAPGLQNLPDLAATPGVELGVQTTVEGARSLPQATRLGAEAAVVPALLPTSAVPAAAQPGITVPSAQGGAPSSAVPEPTAATPVMPGPQSPQAAPAQREAAAGEFSSRVEARLSEPFGPDRTSQSISEAVFEAGGAAQAANLLGRAGETVDNSPEAVSNAHRSFELKASPDDEAPGALDRLSDSLKRAAAAARPALLGTVRDLVEPLVDSQSHRGPPSAPDAWWKDPSATHAAVSVPLFSLRREHDDPGVGKFADLASYYKDTLSKQGVGTVLLLPHFAVLDESPYAPVSLYALSEDQVDWAKVPEVDKALAAKLKAPAAEQRSVDYGALRAREAAAAQEAFAKFKTEQLDRGTARGKEYRDFVSKNAAWIDDYGQFMALSKLIGKPSMEWSAADVAGAQADPRFGALSETHAYAQFVAYGQLRAAVGAVHAAGGKLLFDIPMFRSKNGVDAWKHPEQFKDLKTRNPGIKNQWVNENWMDLALWNWTELKKNGYQDALGPFKHWLEFGFDGGRVDALHFAYIFGNGQMASGDEPGDDYVAKLAQVFQAHGALPLAEAFEGKDANARALGFITVYGDWKKVSTHDDPRMLGFMARFLQQCREAITGAVARFVGYTLGDEWGDPMPIKEVKDGRSFWRYRIPMPSDPDYVTRVRHDARPQLEALKAVKEGSVWKDPKALKTVFYAAGDGFVKHADGSTQIWAASLDWFLEEWGRDTFVSLPGLLLSTGRYAEAKEVIRHFAKHEKDGLIPNKINGAHSEYNTVDGPMWFIQAVKKYAETTGDQDFVKEMSPVLERVVAAYQKGTGYDRYGRFNKIFMDSDGLISSPAQSTWMDADPEGLDRPVTPRNGKPVEVNALWYSNLRYLAGLIPARSAELNALADKVKISFNEKFYFEDESNKKEWGGTGGALKDVVEGDLHSSAIRPNMLFAVSHGGDLLSPERQKAVVLAATKDLLTPYGLRTLSPRDSQYQARYDTSRPPLEKDQAYHQGTTWPWLIGAYADALAVVRRNQGWSADRIAEETRGLMAPLAAFLISNAEGSLPEVFDGGRPDGTFKDFSLDDPKGLGGAFAGRSSNQNPGGTRSQAWSVAEVLRILAERGLIPPAQTK